MREASEDDVPFIESLFQLPRIAEFLNEPGRGAILGLIEDPQAEVYVIEDDGSEAGYFTLHNRDWLVELGVLAVKAPRRGAGRFAMQWGVAYAFEECKAHRVFIEIREDNEPARKLCEGLGFKAEGLYRDGFRDARTGEYKNLIPYGMLRDDIQPATGHVNQGR